MTPSSESVGFLHWTVVPVCPVHPLFKYCQSKHVWNRTINDCMHIFTIQVSKPKKYIWSEIKCKQYVSTDENLGKLNEWFHWLCQVLQKHHSSWIRPHLPPMRSGHVTQPLEWGSCVSPAWRYTYKNVFTKSADELWQQSLKTAQLRVSMNCGSSLKTAWLRVSINCSSRVELILANTQIKVTAQYNNNNNNNNNNL